MNGQSTNKAYKKRGAGGHESCVHGLRAALGMGSLIAFKEKGHGIKKGVRHFVLYLGDTHRRPFESFGLGEY